MKVIIAGSRSITDYEIVYDAVIQAAVRVGIGDEEMEEVVSGGAAGVDRLGERFAALHYIPVKRFKADWNRFGKRAGPLRNEEMATYADALIAVWDGKSRGTAHMIETARKKRLVVYVHNVPDVRLTPQAPTPTIQSSRPTPREIKELLYSAARNQDAEAALYAAEQFYEQRLWTSTAHYEPIEPDGTEVLIRSKRPGTCVLCHVEFEEGELIRWRSRVDCHAECWERRGAK